MRKNFRFYLALWIILLAAFNTVIFLIRPVISGNKGNFDAGFLIAFVFILASFIGNLICAYFAFKTESLQKLLYNIPLITLSRSSLIFMIAAGLVLMLIPGCPVWAAAAVCIIILAINAAAIVKVIWAADNVVNLDEKVKRQTAIIKKLTADAASLADVSKNINTKESCKRVYEALRYSDPMSNEELAEIEEMIERKYDVFSKAATGGAEETGTLADELLTLIRERNNKCKQFK